MISMSLQCDRSTAITSVTGQVLQEFLLFYFLSLSLSLSVFILHLSVLLLLLRSCLYSCSILDITCMSVCVCVGVQEYGFNDDLIALLSSSSPPQQLSKLHQLAMQQTPFTPLGQTTPAFPGTYPPTQRPSLPKLLLLFLPVETNTFSSSFSLSLFFSCLCPFSFFFSSFSS